MEVWQDIEGFEGMYQISNLGRIKSLARRNRIKETILVTPNNTYGYPKVGLCKNGIMFYSRVHRIVAQTFIANPNNHPQINHIDGDKTNNHVSNLEWCTFSHNAFHAYRTGLRKPAYGCAKLKPTDILIIRSRLKNGDSMIEISQSYDVHPHTIGTIKNGKTWKHIL